MPKTLTNDCDLLLQLISTREDVCFYYRIITVYAIQKHRGTRQPHLNMYNDFKIILQKIREIQQIRRKIQIQLIQRYKCQPMDLKAKSVFFGLVNKIIRLCKIFLGKIQSSFPRFAQFISQQTFQMLTNLKDIVFKSAISDVGSVFECIIGIWTQKTKRQASKLLTFYNSYGSMIDKRQQRPQLNYFLGKNQKFLLIVGLQGVDTLVRNYHQYFKKNIFNQKKSQKLYLYDILDVERKSIQPASISDRAFMDSTNGPRVDQGMVEMLVTRGQRYIKDLYSQNKDINSIIFKHIYSMTKIQRKTVKSSNKKKTVSCKDDISLPSTQQSFNNYQSNLRCRNMNLSLRKPNNQQKSVKKVEMKQYKVPLPKFTFKENIHTATKFNLRGISLKKRQQN